MDPLPGWVIIEPEEKKMEGSLHIPDSAKTEIQRGTIVKANNTWYQNGNVVSIANLEPGTKVAFRKYYDNDLEIDGKKYKVVHIDNIFTRL